MADTAEQTEKLLSKENIKDAALFGAEFIPGVGEAMAIKRTSDALEKGDYLGAGIETAAGVMGLIPGVGDLAGKGLRTVSKSLRKKDIEDAEELIGNADKLEQWRKSNKLPESQRQKNIPEAEQAAEDLFQNKIKSREARQKIKEAFPAPELYTPETMPEMPTVTDVVGAMGKKSEKGILGVRGFDLEPGQRVGARLDIPAYNEYDKWVVSIHDGKTRNGSVVGYGQAIRLKNIEFGSDPKVALDIAKGKRVAKNTGEEKPMGKATIARVFGDYVPEDPYELHQFAKKVLADKDSGWTQVGMNPYRGSYFYDKATGTPVTRADEVIQVGPLVLAKNVTKPKMSELKEAFKPAARTAEGKLRVFNEGGAVPMKEQMEMFEDGGLMDEGGTIDPVSGNDVPVGSTQEEVRDDIPAQLSEGEFVFPADVVRYFGLEKLMEMRQEAKAGLQRMEDMGQMGNSEEAILPDDIPFDINDLDMEDEPEYNYQVGGFVPGTAQQQQMGIAGYQAPVMQQTGVAQIPQQQYTPPPIPQAPVPQMQPFARPQQQAVPTMPVPEKLPTFQETITPPSGMAPENREYINPETGERRTFTFINNQPTTEIPAGFIPISEYTAAPKTQTPTTAVQTAQVTEESQSDIDRDKAEREAFARIEQRTEMAKRMGYTNFEGFGAGLLNTLGQAFTPMQSSREAGLVTGGGYISDGKGGLIDPLTGQSIPTNIIRGIIDEFSHIGVDSPETKKYLDDVRRRYEASQTDVGRDIQNKLPAIMVEERYKNLVNKINESDASDERKETLLDIAAEVNKEMKANLAKGKPGEKGYVASNVGMDGRIINPFEAMRIAEKDLIEKMSKTGERRVDTSELRASMGRTAQADIIPGGARPRAKITASSPTDKTTASPTKTEEEERQDEQAEREAAMSNLGEDTTSGLGGTAAELASSYFEKGGLASKKKPKPKRMKRGGLASKK
jgi:hypothetical protein